MVVPLWALLGLASLICLVVFAGLRLVYRRRLDQRREDYRKLVTKTVKSRLLQPVGEPSQDSRVRDDQVGIAASTTTHASKDPPAEDTAPTTG